MSPCSAITRTGVALAGAFALLLASAVPAAHGALAPAWQVNQYSMPTNFAPGETATAGGVLTATYPIYSVTVTNIGAKAADGSSITITDTLPAGLTPAAGHVAEVTPSLSPIPKVCSSAGQVVTCLLTGGAAAVPPGSFFRLQIPVDVSPSASGSVVNTVTVSGGGDSRTGIASTSIGAPVSKFDFLRGTDGIAGRLTSESGAAVKQAGSHPYGLTLEAAFPTKRVSEPLVLEQVVPLGSQVRDLSFSLPSGVAVDPHATAVRCTEAQLVAVSTSDKSKGCPAESQIGVVTLTSPTLSSQKVASVTLYNMVPPPGQPAEFGFNQVGTVVHISGGLGGDFRLTGASGDILAKLFVSGVRVQLWGNPSDASHDAIRFGAGASGICEMSSIERAAAPCPVPRTSTPLLTMPSACSASMPVSAFADSWDEPQVTREASTVFTDTSGGAEEVTGCQTLQFAPSAAITATSSAADSPTGLAVDLNVPQNEGVSTLATANIKDVSVQLPPGMTVNPSAADGLGACSPDQIGLGDNLPATCPLAAKVGTVEVHTPLLDSPLQGSVYLAQQGNNPFGTLLALYVVAEAEGVVVKLPGRVDPDPLTGRLTATFADNPQLPFSHLSIDFFGGGRATLTTPNSCGMFEASTRMTSWASEEAVTDDSPIVIDKGCDSGGFAPALEAGTANPVAGSYSPFTLRVTRKDGEENISSIAATLPDGLLAKLSGVPLCPDPQAADGSCPAGSRVGITTTGVGSGSVPLFIPQPGKAPTAVYLSGPYDGAPFSLVVKVPAQTGPFDLGTIAVRAALRIDPFTAQVTAASDPLPQILHGIPVAYRDLRVEVNRPDFVLNPTDCEPMHLESSITSVMGQIANPRQRFQAAGCGSLAFKPKFKLSLKGATRRSGHPALKAVVTYPKSGRYSNIARAQVGLPHSEFLDQANLDKVCSRPQLLSDACPPASVYGRAKAWSPLLDRPLEGPVYLGVGFGYTLPALVADLKGQVRILLKGKVDTTKQAGLRNTFEAVPDAPVSRFVLEMKGGKKYGLLQNSENICRRPQRASALLRAQNGDALHLQPRIGISCKGKGH